MIIREMQVKQALLIIAAADEQGTVHFADVGSADFPGAVVSLDWQAPLAKQIVEALQGIGWKALDTGDMRFLGPESPEIVRENRSSLLPVMVQLLRKADAHVVPWVPVVALLKRLPATKNRIAYVKAVQFMSSENDGAFTAFDLGNQKTKDVLLKALKGELN